MVLEPNDDVTAACPVRGDAGDVNLMESLEACDEEAACLCDGELLVAVATNCGEVCGSWALVDELAGDAEDPRGDSDL